MSADQPTLPLPALPQAGDFGLLPTYGNLLDRTAAWLIRWGTDAPVNHAFIYLGDGQLVEAAPGGARRKSLDEYDPAAVVWSTGRIPLTDRERDDIVRNADAIARGHVGYGWPDIIAIALAQHRTGRLVNPDLPGRQQPWWVRRIASMRTLICSQLIDICYEGAGVALFTDGRIPGLVSPGDLWRRLGSPAVSAR